MTATWCRAPSPSPSGPARSPLPVRPIRRDAGRRRGRPAPCVRSQRSCAGGGPHRCTALVGPSELGRRSATPPRRRRTCRQNASRPSARCPRRHSGIESQNCSFPHTKPRHGIEPRQKHTTSATTPRSLGPVSDRDHGARAPEIVFVEVGDYCGVSQRRDAASQLAFHHQWVGVDGCLGMELFSGVLSKSAQKSLSASRACPRITRCRSRGSRGTISRKAPAWPNPNHQSVITQTRGSGLLRGRAGVADAVGARWRFGAVEVRDLGDVVAVEVEVVA
jgi:hypothetical protein